MYQDKRGIGRREIRKRSTEKKLERSRRGERSKKMKRDRQGGGATPTINEQGSEKKFGGEGATGGGSESAQARNNKKSLGEETGASGKTGGHPKREKAEGR